MHPPHHLWIDISVEVWTPVSSPLAFHQFLSDVLCFCRTLWRTYVVFVGCAFYHHAFLPDEFFPKPDVFFSCLCSVDLSLLSWLLCFVSVIYLSVCLSIYLVVVALIMFSFPCHVAVSSSRYYYCTLPSCSSHCWSRRLDLHRTEHFWDSIGMLRYV